MLLHSIRTSNVAGPAIKKLSSNDEFETDEFKMRFPVKVLENVEFTVKTSRSTTSVGVCVCV